MELMELVGTLGVGRFLALGTFLVPLFAACGGIADDPAMDAALDGTDAGEVVSIAGSYTFWEKQVSDVRVYYYEPKAQGAALLSGIASIENGCLLVGGVVVIWPEGKMDYVVELIAEVQAGSAPLVEVGGGTAKATPETIEASCVPEKGVWL